jgi:hypothetical protein
MDSHYPRGSLVSVKDNPDNEWQRVWLAVRQHAWTSLALVPSHRGIDVVKLAESLAATGRVRGDRSVTVVDATGVQMAGVTELIESITEAVNRQEWVIVPVDAITENPSAIAVVQAASAALLAVRLGESLLASAQGTLDALGRDRFLGSVLVDESSAIVAG